MARKELAGVLNDLLMELEGGRKAYLLAAERCPESELYGTLVECAHDCTRALHDLQRSVRAFGEPAVERGSAAGLLRLGWVALRAALGMAPAAAVLGHAERQYTRIDKAFEAALAADLPPQERAVVARERVRVRQVAASLARVRVHRAGTPIHGG